MTMQELLHLNVDAVVSNLTTDLDSMFPSVTFSIRVERTGLNSEHALILVDYEDENLDRKTVKDETDIYAGFSFENGSEVVSISARLGVFQSAVDAVIVTNHSDDFLL